MLTYVGARKADEYIQELLSFCQRLGRGAGVSSVEPADHSGGLRRQHLPVIETCSTPPVPTTSESSSSGLDSRNTGRSRSPTAAAAVAPLPRSASVPSPSTESAASLALPLLRSRPSFPQQSPRPPMPQHPESFQQFMQYNHNQRLQIGACPGEVAPTITELAAEAELRHRALLDGALTRERYATSEADRLHTQVVSELLARAEAHRNAHILKAQSQIENLKREYESRLRTLQTRFDAGHAQRLSVEERFTQLTEQVQLLSEELRQSQRKARHQFFPEAVQPEMRQQLETGVCLDHQMRAD